MMIGTIKMQTSITTHNLATTSILEFTRNVGECINNLMQKMAIDNTPNDFSCIHWAAFICRIIKYFTSMWYNPDVLYFIYFFYLFFVSYCDFVLIKCCFDARIEKFITSNEVNSIKHCTGRNFVCCRFMDKSQLFCLLKVGSMENCICVYITEYWLYWKVN